MNVTQPYFNLWTYYLSPNIIKGVGDLEGQKLLVQNTVANSIKNFDNKRSSKEKKSEILKHRDKSKS